ncbi:hypothetical protein [Alkalicoccus luteus]|uniref:Uncharacterized protein n=1 Tax=Alkalicoccus luteus TaxID=1237094 RepID=A0A969PL33_9BACI|nr:hypothetical protein [Alkalicoccus luteus]NJP36170.1 hypothetical protein [Alkalicoccus luteus]
MDPDVRKWFDDSSYGTKEARYEAYTIIMERTKQEVDWAYEVWEELVDDLHHADPHRRARAGQYLAQLAISDPDQRIIDIFPDLWKVTKDEKFVTARHTLQAAWRIGLAGEEQRNTLLAYMKERFEEAESEKNGSLVRSDIIEGLKRLYQHSNDERSAETARILIASLDDGKTKRKCEKIWKS